MFMVLWVIVLIPYNIQICFTANILAIFPLPGISHFNMFQPLLEELAKRGHNVDVISHFPVQVPCMGYKDISIKGTAPLITNATVKISRGTSTSNLFQVTGAQLCEQTLQTEQLQDLKLTTKKYDLLITELFTSDCMLGWAWFFQVPSIVITITANLPWAADHFGLPDNPSYIPNYFVKAGKLMDLFERLVNTGLLKQKPTELVRRYQIYSTKPSDVYVKKFFGANTPDLNVLAQNVSLQLINTHFTVTNVRPLVPNVIEVAGLHIKAFIGRGPKKNLDALLNTDMTGVIYLAFGSVLSVESMPEHTLQAFMDVFSELPYKILWKGAKENFPANIKIPANVAFNLWMPQQEILCDPRVKLFISHGGMMGIQEAVYCAIPLLGIPIFGDQFRNMKYAEEMGYAITLEYEQISRETLRSNINALLTDTKYALKAKEVSEQFKDRLLNPLHTAVYWVEYVIRHKGALGLQSPAKLLSWYQYYLLDIAAVVLGPFILTIYILLKVVPVLIRRKSRKLKKNE